VIGDWSHYGNTGRGTFTYEYIKSRDIALASPYAASNGITEITVYDLFKSTASAANLDVKYRASVLEQIKNSGLLRSYRRNWWNERVLS
jgi:hypothetical protein